VSTRSHDSLNRQNFSAPAQPGKCAGYAGICSQERRDENGLHL